MSENTTVNPDPSEENPAPDSPPETQTEPGTGVTSAVKNVLDEHKGKLAIGAAATLGLMVYYKWREKRLAKEDPEEYARLQRLKAVVRVDGPDKPQAAEAQDAMPQEDKPQFPDQNPLP
ncbi:MAG TPA: hypothetical protein VGU61_20025 [Noviherbaspirillum sp.]|jgi:uncharacterized protein HemX|uniref:hypothetical protein n=1 Tax=Noviherbaspirillum sp. TaxID=1926288 RepID=UPI002DDCFD86|nr:hypothetical protein [Noviherbaspirillum sp.]HEV2612561.1 hypothetical protein [Noviherbaspirillum sp.]